MTSDTMILLPGEIILYILEDKQLNIPDVVNFSTTCISLRKLVNESNKLWRIKFFQKWPFLEEAYTSKELKGGTINWKNEIKHSINSRTKLLYLLSSMSSKHFHKEELCNSEFREYDSLLRLEEEPHPSIYYFLVDELLGYINQPIPDCNLTLKYYALKVIRYLRQSHLKDEWQKFISLPARQQILEYGASIVAQWNQPEERVSYSAISSMLDKIAEQTKEQIREWNPTHSIFLVSNETFAYWKNNIIDDNQWNILETRQVTDALCKVLFEKLKFYGNSNMHYLPENSFIDRVLEHKCGIPITLDIVFESVARRLGVRCEPVIFPSHFLLRWKERYGPEFKDTENFYIDVFNGGQFLTKESCPRIGGVSRCPIEKYNVHEAATVIEVVTRLAHNLEYAVRQYTHLNNRTARLRSVLELLHMIQPNDSTTILKLGRIYVPWGMDLTELINILKNMQEDAELTSRGQANIVSETFRTLQRYQKDLQPEKEIIPRRRVPGVKYAIGLIMRHNLHELCVIFGWDACYIGRESVDEINMNLNNGVHQPFYHIIVEDGSKQYVAEECLEVVPNPEHINHYEIGRYFCRFNGTHYIPNEEKAKEYPEDERICNELLIMHMQRQMACNAI